MMTDPTGRSFLSYRRTQSGDVRLLIAAQRDRGIPTWQDIKDLDHAQTEAKLRTTLNEAAIANAILWITPDIADSPLIKQTEAPAIVRRAEQPDAFFVIPVAASNLDYAEAAALFEGHLGMHHLQQWNMRRISSEPLEWNQAVDIAKAVLRYRIRAIDQTLPPDEPLKIRFHTRNEPPVEPGFALTVDWSPYFDPREASQEAWTERLLPALEDIVHTIEIEAHRRRVLAKGFPALPAVTALGSAFVSTRRRPITWSQHFPDGSEQEWGIVGADDPSGYEVHNVLGDPRAADLAVLVSVSDNVEKAVALQMSTLPSFRVTCHIHHESGPIRHDLTTAGQARHVASLVQQAIRTARSEYPITGAVHLFMAVPAGLAMMIGQRLNTLDAVQTYEYIGEASLTGTYRPAVLLHPSA